MRKKEQGQQQPEQKPEISAKKVDVDNYDLMGPVEALRIDTGIYFSASRGQWE